MQISLEKRKVIERNNIVTVGRLELQKNHSRLIRVFKEVHNFFPHEKLLIYGEGSKREELQNLINQLDLQESVFLKGQTEDVNKNKKRQRFLFYLLIMRACQML